MNVFLLQTTCIFSILLKIAGKTHLSKNDTLIFSVLDSTQTTYCD